LRRDLLATRGLEQRLLAVGDPEEAVAVELADVPRIEPAVSHHLSRGFTVVVIAAHVAWAIDENLVVLRDPQLHAGKRFANGEKTELVKRVRAHAGRSLGQAPTVEGGDAERLEALLDLTSKAGPRA